MPKRTAQLVIKNSIELHSKFWRSLSKPEGFELPKDWFEANPKRRPKE